jgi:hypothetical protein
LALIGQVRAVRLIKQPVQPARFATRKFPLGTVRPSGVPRRSTHGAARVALEDAGRGSEEGSLTASHCQPIELRSRHAETPSQFLNSSVLFRLQILKRYRR